jgi:BirA family biotin operon repressor/biotin-[acetyl-CoA-carboxylase] ligase
MSHLSLQILRFDSLPSTNLEAARRAVEGAPEGLSVIADEQTAGRGRLGRHWVSPKGAGLYFSIILRPRFDLGAWPLITFVAALAVHDALLQSCGLETDIKWPNDVMANNKKLCGVLAETVETRAGGSVVLGIGVNLTSTSFPTELRESATSLESLTGEMPDREAVLQAILEAFQRRYAMLQQPNGSGQVLSEWSQRSSFAAGKRIRVGNEYETLEGISRGLESDGALRLETDSGEIRIVRAGDVTVMHDSIPEPFTVERVNKE